MQVAINDGTSFAMTHKMGLAAMTLGSKSIPNIQYHNASGTLLSGNTDGNTQTVYAAAFSGTNMPFSKDGVNYEIIKSSMTFTGSGTDGWTFTASVSEGNYISPTIQSKRTFIKKGWLYEFTGNIQTLPITQTGNYILEVWGGQGSAPTSYTNAKGGKGGYSYGNKQLTDGNNLYICVGRQGYDYGYDNQYVGKDLAYFNSMRPYNGGGYGHAFGGGATHIASELKATGVLSDYKNYKNLVLIVAGGGGGCEINNGMGGSGGGTNGGTGIGSSSGTVASNNGGGGSQSGGGVGGTIYGSYSAGAAGDFGLGGHSIALNVYEKGSGGGGGWYGGGGSCCYFLSGGGGSGYIGGVDGGSMTNGVREGNGYARITTNFEWAF